MGEERRPVLEQQADAVAVAVAGLRVGAAQALDLAGDLAPAARAGVDAVGGGGDGLDAQELGVAATLGDAAKGLVDGGVGCVHMKSWTAGSAASPLRRSTRFRRRRSAPPSRTRWWNAVPTNDWISSPCASV